MLILGGDIRFKDLAAVSATARCGREVVRTVVNRRITRRFSDYALGEDDFESFTELIHSVGGLVLGRLVESCTTADSSTRSQKGAPICRTWDDLRIIVTGRLALRRVVEWFRERGYTCWKGMVTPEGEPSGDPDFVVGAIDEDRLSKVRSIFPLF